MAARTSEFWGLYIICISGWKGNSVWMKLLPKSLERKILEPLPPEASPVRITCGKEYQDFKVLSQICVNALRIETSAKNRKSSWSIFYCDWHAAFKYLQANSAVWEISLTQQLPSSRGFTGRSYWNAAFLTCLAHLARVFRTNSDPKVSADEGVVDKFCDILKRLSIVFTVTKSGGSRKKWSKANTTLV